MAEAQLMRNVELELAGSGSSLGKLELPGSFFNSSSSWLDLQTLVHKHLGLLMHSKTIMTASVTLCDLTCLLKHPRLLRLFDEHNGPELTKADIRCSDFSTWRSWISSLTTSTTLTKSKVLAVAVYAVNNISRWDFSQKYIRLQTSGELFRQDKECVLAVVACDGCQLFYASQYFGDDEQVVSAAVRNTGAALCNASRRLRHDPNMLLLALETCSHVSIPGVFMQDCDFAKQVVAKQPKYLNLVPHESITTDLEQRRRFMEVLAVAATHKDVDLGWIDRWMWDRYMLLDAVKVNPSACRHAADLATDFDVRPVLHHHGYLLMHTPVHEHTRDFVLDQVAKNGLMLEYATKFQQDKDVVLAAVRSNGKAIKYACRLLQDDQDVVLEAVCNCAHALHHASTRTRLLKEVALAAVARRGATLNMLYEPLKSDEEVVLSAIHQDGTAIQFAGSLKRNKTIVQDALLQTIKALQHVEASEENYCFAVQHHVDALSYINTFPPMSAQRILFVAVAANPAALQFVQQKHFVEWSNQVMLTSEEVICMLARHFVTCCLQKNMPQHELLAIAELSCSETLFLNIMRELDLATHLVNPATPATPATQAKMVL